MIIVTSLLPPKFYYCTLPFSGLPTDSEHAHRTSYNWYKAQFFQFSLRPDEVCSSGWKLGCKCNHSSVPEKTTLLVQKTTEWETYTKPLSGFRDLIFSLLFITLLFNISVIKGELTIRAHHSSSSGITLVSIVFKLYTRYEKSIHSQINL